MQRIYVLTNYLLSPQVVSRDNHEIINEIGVSMY